MAFTESALVPWTPVLPRSCRLFLVVLLVRIWRLNACERLMLPLPRTRKRFFAPLLVFIFGMTSSRYLLPTAVLSCGEAWLPASGLVASDFVAGCFAVGAGFAAAFFGAS